MQSSILGRDHSYTSLGARRRKSDLARFSLDLSWARAVVDSARSRAYPSPPMSGSPPLPPRRNPELSDRGHGSYGSSRHDSFRGMQTPQLAASEHRGPTVRTYAPDPGHTPMPYPGPYSLAAIPSIPNPYQQQQQQQQHIGYGSHSPQVPPPFVAPDRRTTIDASEFTSPKQQRKTKGHVASACVPCKRAHLRCDAQRPCSRCLSNGKEDACVDVQHKKRGRPRLRDEREPRFDAMGVGYHHDSQIRRPLSSYHQGDHSGFTDPLHRSNAYRVLKSQDTMAGSIVPRYIDHASVADANIYGASIPPAPRPAPAIEPACAYLNLEMQILKATSSFGETIGIPSIYQRKLQDVVSPHEREKVSQLQRTFGEEYRERQSIILPPIYSSKLEDDRNIQSLGFGLDEIETPQGRAEMFTFQAPDGQQRTFQTRICLAKKESTYYIILSINLPASTAAFQPQITSPYSRESWSRDSQQYGFHPPHHVFPSNQSVSTFTPNNPGFGDSRGDMTLYRTPGPLGASIPSQPASISFAAIPPRPEYHQSQPSFQAPRSELLPSPSQRQHDLQLPPIRDQLGEGSSMESTRRRDDRSGRVDIGGLLENPDLSRRLS